MTEESGKIKKMSPTGKINHPFGKTTWLTF